MASWLDRMESEWIEEPVFNIHQYIIYYTSSIPCKSSVTLQNQVLPAAPQAGDPQFHLWNLSKNVVSKGSRGSDIGDARQLCTLKQPKSSVDWGGKLSMLTPNLWPLKRVWWARILAILWLSLSANKHGSFYKSARGCENSPSLSLSLMRMEHISMTLVSHKMCEQHLLSLIINTNVTIPSIFHYHASQKRTQIFSQLGILSIPTRSNNDLDYVTSRFASADVKPGRVTLQVTMGTPSSAVGRLSKNVRC